MHPTLIPDDRLIANVNGVMNAILVQGDAVGPTLYYGPGAGSEPTASAVVADLVDVTRLATADPHHRVPHLAFQPDALHADLPILPMDEVETAYYLRMRVADETGVLADITRILADRSISIDAMLQKEPDEGEEQVDIIFKAFRNERFSHKGKHYTLPPEVPYRGYQLKDLTLVPRPIHFQIAHDEQALAFNLDVQEWIRGDEPGGVVEVGI